MGIFQLAFRMGGASGIWSLDGSERSFEYGDAKVKQDLFPARRWWEYHSGIRTSRWLLELNPIFKIDPSFICLKPSKPPVAPCYAMPNPPIA